MTTSAYHAALSEEYELALEALGHIAAEEAAGRITARQAAAERLRLLNDHLERCRQLRLTHLGPEVSP